MMFYLTSVGVTLSAFKSLYVNKGIIFIHYGRGVYFEGISFGVVIFVFTIFMSVDYFFKKFQKK
jgi:hypothetical protein